MYEKLKSLLQDDSLYIVILLILVGLISFGLGRQSVLSDASVIQPAGIIFTDVPVEDSVIEEIDQIPSVQVVSSKSGTKYHSVHCPGATQIKEENKIYFESKELAQAAGYTAAANCPGL
jgi:hypothetical protein